MSNPRIAHFDTSKIFLGGYVTDKGTYTAGGAEADLGAGTIVGRVTATGKIKPCDSSAEDGSQVPIGILFTSYVVPASTDQTVTYAIRGDVDAAKLTYADGDDEDTVVNLIGADSASPAGDVTVPLGTIKDVLQGKGFTFKTLDEQTQEDND